MTSKYDRYWAACLGQIQAALGRAAGGSPAAVATPGLRDLGPAVLVRAGRGPRQRADAQLDGARHLTGQDRRRQRDLRASGPRTPSGSPSAPPGTPSPSPPPARPARPGKRPRHRQPHRAPVTPAGELRASTRPSRPRPGPARVMAGRAGPGEFYRLLAGLGGARRLRDCRAGDCPPGGVYFFFEDGEVRSDSSSRVVRVGTHALTAASKRHLVGPAPAAPRAPGRPRSRQRQPPGLGIPAACRGRAHPAATDSHRDCSHPGSTATARTRAGPARKPLSKWPSAGTSAPCRYCG